MFQSDPSKVKSFKNSLFKVTSFMVSPILQHWSSNTKHQDHWKNCQSNIDKFEDRECTPIYILKTHIGKYIPVKCEQFSSNSRLNRAFDRHLTKKISKFLIIKFSAKVRRTFNYPKIKSSFQSRSQIGALAIKVRFYKAHS